MSELKVIKPIETSLEFDSRISQYVVSGCMTTTIRKGHRYFAKRITIANYTAIVIDFKHYILMTTPLKCLLDEGYRTMFEAIRKLQRYYPDIKLNSPITVLKFRLEVIDEGSTKKFRPNANL